MCFPPLPLAVPYVLSRCEQIPKWKDTTFVFAVLAPFCHAQSRYASFPYMEGGIFPESVVAWLRAHVLCGALHLSPREVHLPPLPHLHFGLGGLPDPHFVETREKVDMLWEGRAACLVQIWVKYLRWEGNRGKKRRLPSVLESQR